MNNLPGTFSLRNHFSSSPLFRPRSMSQALPEVRYFFRRNHFSSCRPAEPVRLEAAREVGFARGPRHSFRGNHFSSFLPADTAAAGSTDIWLTPCQGTAEYFSREPLSLIPLGSRRPRLPQILSNSSFSSSSLLGG